MHELTIARSVLEALAAEAALHPDARPTRAGLRVGPWAGVDPSALEFCLANLLPGTTLEGLRIEIEIVPRRRRCASCEAPVDAIDPAAICPRCGSVFFEDRGGDDLDLAFLELDA